MMVDHMCNLSLGIARENAYRGYSLGLEKGEQNFGKLIQILIKEGKMEEIQEVTDDAVLRESLYRKYHIE